MDIISSILPWLGLFFGSAVAKYYIFAAIQPRFNRPEILWNPIGHLICLTPIVLGVWSAFYLPWWAIVILTLFAPHLLVFFDLYDRYAEGRKKGPVKESTPSENTEPIPASPDIVIRDLLRRGGHGISDQDQGLLWKGVTLLTSADRLKLDEYETLAIKGFFNAALEGYSFVPLKLIKENFGGSLSEVYPEAGTAFMKMAQSYWTLKLVTHQKDYRANVVAGHELFSQVELAISSVFFPTPGPAPFIDPDTREEKQRELLSHYCPAIDVEDFISKNPILLRDRGITSL